ncbi:MAG: ATP-binding protein [Caldilineaceae bacterium]|nr:ATP-binding protein [Caldilineaceae bacterium]
MPLPSPLLKRQLVLNSGPGHFIETGSRIHLLVGNPAPGKSHIAIALGLAACRQDQRVRFHTVTHSSTPAGGQAKPPVARLCGRAPCAITHHSGRVRLCALLAYGCPTVLQFCSALHERTSLLLTTNLPFSQWAGVGGCGSQLLRLAGSFRATI